MPPKVLGSKEDLGRLRKRLVHPRRTLGELLVGVRDLVARGYFILGGVRQRGGGQAPMFPCRTLSDLDYPGLRSVTCDVSSRWVLTTVQ